MGKLITILLLSFSVLMLMLWRSTTSVVGNTVNTAMPRGPSSAVVTQISNGPHVLTAKAFDAAGNSASASITVIVDNNAPLPPTGLSLTRLERRTNALWWVLSATAGVDSYRVSRNGVQLAILSGAASAYRDSRAHPTKVDIYQVRAGKGSLFSPPAEVSE